MPAKVLSAAVLGLDAEIVEVESDVGFGPLGAFSIVGLPDAAVNEAKERVRLAIKNSGFTFPKRKVIVNLAPADIRKQGPSYDLPIAVSILLSTDRLAPFAASEDKLFVGELALDGAIRQINGALSMATMAIKKGKKQIFVPADNAAEAKLAGEIEVFPVKDLAQLTRHLSGKENILPEPAREFAFANQPIVFDMAHIAGQEHVKRAMEIAAAGAHNIMMSGPPGSGKTLIARTLPSILPDLSLEEAIELTKIYSVAGKLNGDTALMTFRPFRSPHHTASGAALVGGGAWPRPGEISLAHRGVLFLDEFAEFPRQVLENLRQPLEDGVINVSRAAGNLAFPAKFILVAAMNPCPCGYLSDPDKECICTPIQVANYRKKISGPIIDRIDMHIEVPRVKFDKLSGQIQGESSAAVKERVEAARRRQQDRFKGTNYISNSEISSEAVKRYCALDENTSGFLKIAAAKLKLSARAYFRVLKLARTIADLAGSEQVHLEQVAEALQYRPPAE